MSSKFLQISDDAVLELSNIHHGVFSPLLGFVDESDYRSIIEDMHLKKGNPWTIPVTLDIPEDKYDLYSKANEVVLTNKCGTHLGKLEISSIFKVNFENDIPKIFGVTDKKHPGIIKELNRSIYRAGGKTTLFEDIPSDFPQQTLTPAQTRQFFKDRNWHTVTGFQTRNPIHRAHEYLQRIALEISDGLMIQPLIGWKKSGDISPEGVLATYEKMVSTFYPANRTLLNTLRTPMRYAGPREAVFHALIRKNYGCTHFIVGRDHAGVGNYYEKYEAQKLCRHFNNLGIEILALAGPYFCTKCQGIVTEKTCPHGEEFTVSVSGTEMRRLLNQKIKPPTEYMRPEISDILIQLNDAGKLFVK